MPDLVSRRSLAAWLGGSALLGSSACSTRPGAPATVVSALAPSGRLRACINLGNPILASMDAATGRAVGVSVDLAGALAAQLGVGLEWVLVDAAVKSVDAVRSGRADVGFFAIDPLRGDGIRFSAPYVLIEGAYLVREDSGVTDKDQVDRPGMRVMVGAGSAYDLHLSRALKFAQLLRTPTSQAVVDQFLSQRADVAAGVRQQLVADAARLGGLRLLPGRFMVIEQAMGVQAGRGAAVEQLLGAFVELAKTSGLVARSLERHGIRGATVAPAA